MQCVNAHIPSRKGLSNIYSVARFHDDQPSCMILLDMRFLVGKVSTWQQD